MTKSEAINNATTDKVVVGIIEGEPCILGTKNGQFMFFRIHKAVCNNGCYALNIGDIKSFLEAILDKNPNNKIASFEEKDWNAALEWLLASA